MEEKKNGKVLAIVALLIAVAGLSLGYAALQTSLTINGTASVSGSSWDVHFEDLSAATLVSNQTPSTAAEVTHPEIVTSNGIASTKIGDYSVTLKSPGDSVSYTFKVVNDGSYDAKIAVSGVTMNTRPTCNPADTGNVKVCENLSYTLVYVGGTKDGLAPSAGDTIAHGESVTMKLTLSLSSSLTAGQLASTAVDISGLGVTLLYVQA